MEMPTLLDQKNLKSNKISDPIEESLKIRTKNGTVTSRVVNKNEKRKPEKVFKLTFAKNKPQIMMVEEKLKDTGN